MKNYQVIAKRITFFSKTLKEVNYVLNLLQKHELDKADILKFAKKTILISWALAVFDLLSIFILAEFIQQVYAITTGIKVGETGVSKFFSLNLLTENLEVIALYLGLLFVIIYFAKSILSLLLSQFILSFLARKSTILGLNVSKKILSSENELIQKRSEQELLISVNSANVVMIQYLGSFIFLLGDFGGTLLMFIGILFYDVNIGLLVSIGLLTLARVLHYFGSRRVFETSNALAHDEAAHAIRFSENLFVYKEILLRSLQKERLDSLNVLRTQMAKRRAELTLYPVIGRYILELGTFCVLIFVSVFQFILNDILTALTTASILLVAFTRLFPAALRIQNNLLNLKQAYGSSSFTLDVLNYSSPKQDQVLENTDTLPFQAHIKVENLYFSYENESETLSDVSFEILPGQLIAIVGKSGSGKSTLVSLLLGFLLPTMGRVTISGKDPVSAMRAWPGKISYVPQETRLLRASLTENICLIPPSSVSLSSKVDNLRLEEVKAIAKISHLDEGATVFTGNGVSGGEKQRIALARALYSCPDVLYLDEATSALDLETEKEIEASLFMDTKGLTRIVVTHRLTTAKRADRILYLENGKVAAFGTYDELLSQNPRFVKLAELSTGLEKK